MPDAVYTTAAALAHPTSDLALKDGRQQYTNSTLANVFWTYALERRVRDAGKNWSVNAFDPWLMPGTGLARDNEVVLRFIWRILQVVIPLLRLLFLENMHTTAGSGSALAGCAVEGEGVSRRYFEGARVMSSSEESHMVGKQEELWGWTLNAVSKDKEERMRFERLE